MGLKSYNTSKNSFEIRIINNGYLKDTFRVVMHWCSNQLTYVLALSWMG